MTTDNHKWGAIVTIGVLLIFSMMLHSSDCFASSFGIEGNFLRTFFPIGNTAPKSGEFQPDLKDSRGTSLGLNYFWGTQHGPVVSAFYINQHMKYVDLRTPPSTPHYKSEATIPTVAVGYFVAPPEPVRIWSTVGFGRGNFKFQDANGTLAPHKETLQYFQIAVKAAYLLRISSITMPFILGVEYLKMSARDFSYNGVEIPGRAYKADFHYVIGLGLEI